MIEQKSTLDSSALALHLGITERAARKALARCFAGKTWNGHRLNVKLVSAAGGPGGVRYEVETDSLPGFDIEQPAFIDSLDPVGPASATVLRTIPDLKSQVVLDAYDWKFRLQIIGPVLATAPRSRERGQAIKRAAAQNYMTPNGPMRVTSRTIRRWVTEHEARGIAGLARKKRADRGKPQVLISRAWDSLKISTADQERIACELVTYVRSLWAGPTVFAGWKVTAQYASIKLRTLTAEALGVAESEVSANTCSVPRSFVDREKDYKIVGLNERDRKAVDDKTRPRITRSIANLQPMQIVMGDVHPLDIYYRRDDGSSATAKLIAFLDVATRRIKIKPEFFEKGHGVCEAHVIRAFIDMARDEQWGLPSQLYLDNGSEYQWDGLINDAISLAGLKVFLNGQPDARSNTTVRAQPYNAAAKGDIEGTFGILERNYFSLIPGWIGGDRSRAKAANVGKSPVKYPGTKEDLIRTIKNVEIKYNNDAQDQGRIKGDSPNGRFAALIKAGWKRTDIEESSLYAAFCARESRIIRQGKIRHKGRTFYHDALAALPADTSVSIGIPKWGETERLSVWDEANRFLCVADLEPEFAHGDTEGAVETGRRNHVNRASIAAKKSRTVPIDGNELLALSAALAEPLPHVESGAVVTFDPDRTAAGRALSVPAAESREIEDQRNSDAQSRQRAALRRLMSAEGCDPSALISPAMPASPIAGRRQAS